MLHFGRTGDGVDVSGVGFAADGSLSGAPDTYRLFEQNETARFNDPEPADR